ncbi:MFS transporter [Companilactobacillus sp. DQM5]|uniref:MFS transporter n=1 Tax=Companilactobacillus sp. DQM5 TaxID=3463359 RepID=UPI00405A405E
MEKEEQTQNPKRWLILIVIGIFAFMSNLDSSIVNVALPVISHKLNVPMNQINWIVSIYLVLLSALLLFFGKLGDIKGKNLVFRIGTVVFVLGSSISGLGLNFSLLLLGRAVQAIGSAMTLSNTYGMVTSTFPLKERGRAMGLIGTFVSLGAIAGPSLGGFILAVFSWPYIFLINIPIGAFAIILGWFVFSKNIILSKESIDWLGVLLQAISIIGVFGGIFIGQDKGYNNLLTIIMLGVGIITAILFIFFEKKTLNPLLNMKIFTNKVFTYGISTAFLIFIANFFTTIIIPFYLELSRGYSAGYAGMLLIIYPLIMVVFGPIGGALADKWNVVGVQIIGTSLIFLGNIMYFFMTDKSPIWLYIIITSLLGIGMGLFQSPNGDVVMSAVKKSELGIAGSINALFRNLGFSAGSALATSILFAGMSIKSGKIITNYVPSHPEWFIYGMHIAFIISAVLALGAIVMSVVTAKKVKKVELK